MTPIESSQPLEWSELTRLTAGREVTVERVRLKDNGVAIEGSFELPALAQLSLEDQSFIVAFVRTHGSIKRMEEILGVSYPTVKSRLNRLGEKFEFVEVDHDAAPVAEPEGASDALEALREGRIDVEEALRQIQRTRI